MQQVFAGFIDVIEAAAQAVPQCGQCEQMLYPETKCKYAQFCPNGLDREDEDVS